MGATGTISKLFKKMPEQHIVKPESHGTTENSPCWALSTYFGKY